MTLWQLQEVKARLTEVIKKATREGPQGITVRGEPAAVIVSTKEFERLKQPKPSFLELMRSSPLVGIELDLEREQTNTRETDLA
jgi:prevent-host-death family protein